MLRSVPTPMADSTAERVQRFAAFAVLVGALLALVLRAACAPDVAFLVGSGWLTNPREVDARVQQWGAAHVPVARFTRRLDLATVPATALLSVEAARAHRVQINGAPIWESGDPDPRWRRGDHRMRGRGVRRGG